MKVAVAVAVEDSSGRLLLTRRHPRMRTFPEAWVMPGGGVDARESLAAAAHREVQEETGLDIDVTRLKMLGCWESVFPTTCQACRQLGEVKGHHLVVFFKAPLRPSSAAPRVRLQVAEADKYCWLTRDQVLSAVDFLRGDSHDENVGAYLNVHGCDSSKPAVEPLAKCLGGIYPNKNGEGIGQGHLFGLVKWAEVEAKDLHLQISEQKLDLGPRAKM
jgi:8-oxo-dGTP pyrophosphatase MutT (NUDIX family)